MKASAAILMTLALILITPTFSTAQTPTPTNTPAGGLTPTPTSSPCNELTDIQYIVTGNWLSQTVGDSSGFQVEFWGVEDYPAGEHLGKIDGFTGAFTAGTDSTTWKKAMIRFSHTGNVSLPAFDIDGFWFEDDYHRVYCPPYEGTGAATAVYYLVDSGDTKITYNDQGGCDLARGVPTATPTTSPGC